MHIHRCGVTHSGFYRTAAQVIQNVLLSILLFMNRTSWIETVARTKSFSLLSYVQLIRKRVSEESEHINSIISCKLDLTDTFAKK